MARDFARRLYDSAAWKACRAEKISRTHGLCEKCLASGYYVPGTEVHHKIHLTAQNINDPAVALNLENLILLCRDCHAAAHKSEKRIRFDANGNIIGVQDGEAENRRI